jgi:hypothetical protein
MAAAWGGGGDRGPVVWERSLGWLRRAPIAVVAAAGSCGRRRLGRLAAGRASYGTKVGICGQGQLGLGGEVGWRVS